jgi:hypothetical protein
VVGGGDTAILAGGPTRRNRGYARRRSQWRGGASWGNLARRSVVEIAVLVPWCGSMEMTGRPRLLARGHNEGYPIHALDSPSMVDADAD